MSRENEWQLVGVRKVRGSESERACDGCGEVLEAGKEVIVYRRGDENMAAHSESCRRNVCEEIGVPFKMLPEGMLTEKGREEYGGLVRGKS